MVISVIVSLLVPMALLVALIVGTRAALKGRLQLGAQEVREFFQYALTYGLVVIVGVGLSGLLSALIGARTQLDGLSNQEFAQSLAFVAVGAPLLALLALWSSRRHKSHPGEDRSLIYAAYVTATALTAVLVVAFAIPPLMAGIAAGSLNRGALASALIWGLIWYFHWRLGRRTLPSPHNAPHLLLGSVIGTVVLVVGFIQVVELAWEVIGTQLWGGTVVVGAETLLGLGLGAFLTGAAIWVRYWVSAAQNLPRNTLWLMLTLPLGVGGGLVLTLTAASTALWRTLVWFFGETGGISDASFVRSLLGSVAGTLAGILLWWYFRTVLGPDLKESPSAYDTYLYIVSGISLLAVSVGVASVVSASIEAATASLDIGVSPVNTLLLGGTAITVGGAVWGLFWTKIQSRQSDHQVTGTGGVVRRIYMLIVVWTSAIAATIALVSIAVTFAQSLVDGTLRPGTLREARWSIGVFFAALAILAYHGSLSRAERKPPVLPGITDDRVDKAAHPAPCGPSSAMFVGLPEAFVAQVEAAELGTQVTALRIMDDVSVAPDTATLVAQLSKYPGNDVIVVREDQRIRIIAVQSR